VPAAPPDQQDARTRSRTWRSPRAGLRSLRTPGPTAPRTPRRTSPRGGSRADTGDTSCRASSGSGRASGQGEGSPRVRPRQFGLADDLTRSAVSVAALRPTSRAHDLPRFTVTEALTHHHPHHGVLPQIAEVLCVNTSARCATPPATATARPETPAVAAGARRAESVRAWPVAGDFEGPGGCPAGLALVPASATQALARGDGRVLLHQ